MQKSNFGQKILQEHATTIQLALLSYIFIDLSRDTPLAHTFFGYGPMAIWPYGHIWPYLAIWPSHHIKKIWASGVSLERAIKMQLSSANQMVVACSYKILWPKIDFLIFFPHFPLSTGHFFQHGGQVRKMQKKSFFLQKWPVPMLVQNISRGHEILKTFWIFGAP